MQIQGSPEIIELVFQKEKKNLRVLFKKIVADYGSSCRYWSLSESMAWGSISTWWDMVSGTLF